MASSTNIISNSNSNSSNWSSVDIDDEMELSGGLAPPMAEIEEEDEEEDEVLLDYEDDEEDDDDDDSMISGDYPGDEDLPPEETRRPISIYTSASGGVEDANTLGLSELSDTEDLDVAEEEKEEEEETTKCCGKGAMKKIKGAFIGFARAAVAIIYKVYAMMTPKQKMVIVGAATAAMMSMVGVEKETITDSADADSTVADDTPMAGEGEDAMTPTDVLKDVASDVIEVIMDSIDRTEQ